MNAWLLDVSYALVEASSESGTPWLLLLVGPAGGAGVYWGIYQYYRNTNKSHAFERETLIEAQPVTGQDRKIDTVKGTRRTEIKGNNVTKHRDRVQRLD